MPTRWRGPGYGWDRNFVRYKYWFLECVLLNLNKLLYLCDSPNQWTRGGGLLLTHISDTNILWVYRMSHLINTPCGAVRKAFAFKGQWFDTAPSSFNWYSIANQKSGLWCSPNTSANKNKIDSFAVWVMLTLSTLDCFDWCITNQLVFIPSMLDNQHRFDRG